MKPLSSLPVYRARDLVEDASHVADSGAQHELRLRSDSGSLGIGMLLGRIVELYGAGSTTVAMGLAREAQITGERAVWIAGGSELFFPPDAAAHGVRLSFLPVVRAESGREAARSADLFVRSGAYGLVVMDLGAHTVEEPVLGRLLRLAALNRSAVVCRTEGSYRLGSLVGLRGRCVTRRIGQGRFRVELVVEKDKRHGPNRVYRGEYDGPPGLL